MPNTFDDASKATQQMFEDDADLTIDDAITANEEDTPPATAEPGASAEPAKETSGNETPADSGASSQVAEPTNTEAVVADAAQTAEAAANLAAQKDQELAQTKQALEAAQQQNAQLQQTIDGMSAQKKEEIIEEALTPPTLDIGALAFADEETVRKAQAKYAEDMLAYNRKQIMKELEPVINHAKKGMYESEKKEAIAALSHQHQYTDELLAHRDYQPERPSQALRELHHPRCAERGLEAGRQAVQWWSWLERAHRVVALQ